MTLSHKNMLFLSLKFPFLTDIEKEKFQKKQEDKQKTAISLLLFLNTPNVRFFTVKNKENRRFVYPINSIYKILFPILLINIPRSIIKDKKIFLSLRPEKIYLYDR